jgi:ATP-binding cassette, subfamily C (CFTR/MRP), member 1
LSLDAEIREHGENLSVGQRQLVCLARAILVQARIIILDEATASVDLQTDAILQKVLREHFHSSTVITVAHRLNTIMDYDRVLVMKDGRVCEFATPHQLLQDPDGAFTSLVEETGPANAALLRSMAERPAMAGN